MRELNAVIGAQSFAVIGLEPVLRSRQERAARVVDQIERKARLAPIANGVQTFKRLDALVEHTFSTLCFDVFTRVAGQRTHQPYTARRVPGRQVFLFGLQQYGEIAACRDLAALREKTVHEAAEVGIDFRRAAGDVRLADMMVRAPVENARNGLPGHDLGAFRAGIDVAMMTGLIA